MGEVLHAIAVFFEQLASVELRRARLAICCHLLKTRAARAGRGGTRSRPPTRRSACRGVDLRGVRRRRRRQRGHPRPRRRRRQALPRAPRRPRQHVHDARGRRCSCSRSSTPPRRRDLRLRADARRAARPRRAAGLPGFDFGFFAANPEFSLALLAALAIFGVVGVFWPRCTSTSSSSACSRASPCCATGPRYLRTVAAWQAADWTLRFVAIWFFLDAFDVDQSLRNVLLVQVTQSLATLVPISPGGIGTEQAFIVFVFEGAVPRSLLLAFSVGMKLTLITVNAIVGFTALFLMLGHVRWRDVTGGRDRAERDGRRLSREERASRGRPCAAARRSRRAVFAGTPGTPSSSSGVAARRPLGRAEVPRAARAGAPARRPRACRRSTRAPARRGAGGGSRARSGAPRRGSAAAAAARRVRSSRIGSGRPGTKTSSTRFASAITATRGRS